MAPSKSTSKNSSRNQRQNRNNINEASNDNASNDKQASSPFIGPVTPPTDLPVSPDVLALYGQGLIASSAMRQARRVSKQAAMNTKKQIWDSNDASIVAAQSAVDQWEHSYNGLRGLMCAIGDSAQGLYGAAKAGVSGLEHGFLSPVRDWVLLPAFGGVEKIAGETVGFLQSNQAQELAHQSLDLARQVPWVGENLLAPALCIGAEALKKTWEVAQYPIPSPSQVRESVDFVMTGTKWALSTAGREVFLYVRRADANITRSLSHTQWKVLGSGPYATLDKLNKREVIDHLCERYFSLVDVVARYELAAHIRAHNRPLYHDLVLTGLLRERGGLLTVEDEWLSTSPRYRDLEAPFLLDPDEEDECSEVFSMWFRLPNHNGKKPRKDTPWVAFGDHERRKLEDFYRAILETNQQNRPSQGTESRDPHNIDDDDDDEVSQHQRYATNARWYDPDPEYDLLLDQKRHAVSSFPCCPKCRQRHDKSPLEIPRALKQFGELCDGCAQQNAEAPWVDTLLSPPPVVSIYRPTMWRFYGPGDELRRATWFLDTPRHGLQPYGEDAQAVLEDAYLFLKWTGRRRVWDGSILLTVQVPSPDGGEQQLVQFSSLSSATAIGKGLGSAIALFKRRVYRGAYHERDPIEDPDHDPSVFDGSESVDQSMDGLSYTEEEASESAFDEAALEPPAVQDETNFRSSSDEWVELGADESGSATIVSSNVSSRELSKAMNVSHEMSEADLNQMVDLAETAVVDAMNLYSGELKNLRVRLSQTIDEHLLLAYPLKREEEDSDEKVEDVIADDGSDDVDHLVLIVHGVGEMLQSINFFGLSQLPTIVDCCGFLRKNHSEVLEVRFNQLYKKLDGIRLHRKGPGRVEYLPVEWHDSFTIQSQRRLLDSALSDGPMARNYTMKDISLGTIPQLRQFANDTLMDVLFFMSPEHHDVIVDIVVNEMNFIVERFRALTGFKGDVSLVGHSLGSIISWDILDNQRGFRASLRQSERHRGMEQIPPLQSMPPASDMTDSEPIRLDEELPDLVDKGTEYMSPTHADTESESQAEAGVCTDIAPDYPQLAFEVDNAFMLGSPIAVFLMIRNQRKPLSTDYKLSGCSQVFNIFHPYDPVAYRIEPLMDPRNAEIEPKIMTHWHGGFRYQYQTKLLWKKIVEETVKTQENVVASLESGIAALGLLDGTDNDNEDEEEEFSRNVDPHMVVTGSLNRGHRIDYMLQEKELESANEYVAALAAHSCYWLEKDLSLFIARQICLRALERDDGEESSTRKRSYL